jgi:hypothetical protein
MLKEKTLFVVGAGASKEFNLPLGFDLKHQIAVALYQPPEDRSAKGGIVMAVQTYIQQNRLDYNAIWAKAKTIAGALPLAGSIDGYIESHSHDKDVLFLGKLAIAASLRSPVASRPIPST